MNKLSSLIISLSVVLALFWSEYNGHGFSHWYFYLFALVLGVVFFFAFSFKDGKEEIEELIEKANVTEMTPEEKEAQRRSFAFGNANIDNPNVTREMIDEAADEIEFRKK